MVNQPVDTSDRSKHSLPKKRELAKKAGYLIKYNLHHINYKIFNVHEKHNYEAKKVYAPYATSLEYIT